MQVVKKFTQCIKSCVQFTQTLFQNRLCLVTTFLVNIAAEVFVKQEFCFAAYQEDKLTFRRGEDCGGWGGDKGERRGKGERGGGVEGCG